MTTTAIDINPTDAQMATPHSREDVLTRRTAWRFENIYAHIRTYPIGQFENLVNNYGQSAINTGSREVAKSWVEFATTKLLDDCKAKAAELAAAYERGELSGNDAIGQLYRFSGGRIRQDRASLMLANNLS